PPIGNQPKPYSVSPIFFFQREKFILFGKGNKKEETTSKGINWQILQNEDQLKEIINESNEKPVAIFKHSIRCSISSMAKRRLERNWDIAEDTLTIYYLDLITFRSVSNKIVDVFEVQHESPQIILIKNGEVIFHTSHSDISVEGLKEEI
ncbi:MAG: bacillithiol system redox-active protein YtxJ, partial [Chitinophagales bacterium]